MKCSTCKKEIHKGLEHTFITPNYTEIFCDKCCPIDYDKLRCDKAHQKKKTFKLDPCYEQESKERSFY